MKRCTVCREKIYRGLDEHIRIHQIAAARRNGRPRAVYAPAMESAELVGVGTEVTIPRPSAKPGIWASVLRFLGLGS